MSATGAGSPRAFALTRDGRSIGTLVEGPGAFASAKRSKLRHTRFPHAHFVSRHALSEGEVRTAIIDHDTFDGVVDALRATGFTLEPVAAPGASSPREAP